MWLHALICLLVFIATIGGDVSTSETTNQVSLNLFKAVMDDNVGNSVFSPVCVSMLLSILQQGALGETLRQLNEVLHADAEQSRALYGKIAHNLKKSTNSSIIIELATNAFINKGFKIKAPFKKILVQEFNSDIGQLDFSDANFAAKHINDWVKKETRGKVDQIVSEDMLDADVQLLLANAMFFKGAWLSPFKPGKTRDRPFKLDGGKEISIPTMHRVMFLTTGEMPEVGFKWAEFPFQGNQFAMYILLPDEGKKLSTLVEHLATTDTFSTILKNKRRRNLNVALPKFELSSHMNLMKTLEKIGVHDIFSEDRSKLTGITDQFVYVSEVIQRAKLMVDERGGTAASSTGVVLRLRSALDLPLEIINFTVNRPFLLFIVDKDKAMVLFAGRVTDPSKT